MLSLTLLHWSMITCRSTHKKGELKKDSFLIQNGDVKSQTQEQSKKDSTILFFLEEYRLHNSTAFVCREWIVMMIDDGNSYD